MSACVRPATTQDLEAVRNLLRGSHHVYWAAGLEDLPDLLRAGTAAVAVQPGGRVWGFVAFQVEERPDTLPPHAPTRVYLRLAGLERVTLDAPVDEMVRVALAGVPPGHLGVAISGHSWLLRGLGDAGFELHDHIVFFERTRREIPVVQQVARLRPLAEDEWDALARLDAASFTPLWHMGRSELRALALSCRFQVAEWPDRPGLIGYTALSIHPAADPLEDRAAQLVRLAVHSEAQGHGVGRQLLAEAIAYAVHQRAHRIRLNTQLSNRASQALYRAMDFRRRGHPIPVLTAALPLSPG